MTVRDARIVRAADLVRTAWKNGGGTTAEIAVFPDGAGLDAVEWRISLADVAADGPFSVFPGLDRTLTVVEGAGITLHVDEVSHRLDANGPSLRFSGEARTTSMLTAGPIRDLNVMTKRGAFTHRVCIAGPGGSSVAAGTVVLAVVALTDHVEAKLEGEACGLGRLDGWLVHLSGEPHDLVLDGSAIVIEIGRAGSAHG